MDQTSISPEQTMAEIAADMPKSQTPIIGKSRLSRPDVFSEFLILHGFTHWFFRLGFASIFLVNAVYAIFEPDSFAGVLEANPIASAIGFTDFMVKIAIVNDLLLSIFIIGGWRKKEVYAWAGAWLLMVAALKLMNLLF
jgi:hypothetical protein